jgi:citrate synthase
MFPGLAGVAAFPTSVSRADAAGGILRYRGVAIDELAGHVCFGGVWRLLVEGRVDESLLADVTLGDLGPLPPPTGDGRIDIQRMASGLTSRWGLPAPAAPADRLAGDLAQITVAVAVYLGDLLGKAGGREASVPDAEVRRGTRIAERLVIAWNGAADAATVRVLDTLMSTIAEHGTTASTFTARVVASTQADAALCVVAALSAVGGPRHGGAAGLVLGALHDIRASGTSASAWISQTLDNGRRLPGMGHRIYRGHDPRVAS